MGCTVFLVVYIILKFENVSLIFHNINDLFHLNLNFILRRQSKKGEALL